MNLDFGAVETLRKVLKKIECNEELDFQEQWVAKFNQLTKVRSK